MILQRHHRFAQIALNIARELDQEITHQLCAIIVRKNKILSVGYNSPKTHPIASTKMQQLHAEAHAIVRCPDNELKGAELIVVRARPSGFPGLAKPCDSCASLIRKVGIRKVFYTISTNNPTSYLMECIF